MSIANKIWRFLRWFAFVEKLWRWPRPSDVLIFDAAGKEFLLEYLSPWNPVVLHVRGEQVNIPVLLASFLGRGPLNRFRYYDRFVAKVQPRLIVTFIDNNPAFYTLGVRNPNVRTLFVQNGVKSYYGDVIELLDGATSTDEYRVDYMMTFGSRPGALYAKYIEGKVIPMGSLRSNLIPRRRFATAGTIAFISQYRPTEGFVMAGAYRTREAFFERADRFILSFLTRYAQSRGKMLSIVTVSRNFDAATLRQEREYYERLLGQACVFSDDRGLANSYDSVDAAEVVVTIDSALGYESAARGNKTAFFSIRGQLLGIAGRTFGWPGCSLDEGLFWTNSADTAAFERILDHLFTMSAQQWKDATTAHHLSEIMVYDPGNAILQSVLRKELGASPTRLGDNPAATPSLHQ